MELTEEGYLAHYGILRKSGRYPWGSGNNPHQRSKTFLQILEDHKKKDGLSESEIAELYDDKENGFPFSVADLRAVKSRSVNIQKREQIRQAQRLREKGMSPSEIARQMSTPEKKLNESTIRSYLEPGRLEKLDILEQTAEMLKRQVAEKTIVDIGAHVERDLPVGMGDNPAVRHGISKDKFNTAISMLKEEGYQVHILKGDQVGTGEKTTYRVLIKGDPKKSYKENQKWAWMNQDKIQVIAEKSPDGGRTWEDTGFKKPLSIDAKRVGVRYKEQGGADADGVIYVRPGVPDISLGRSQYAQVRIAVNGTHFLKGMAVYKDDLPKGVDLVFNTNKSDTGNKLDAMKELRENKDGTIDWTNPFGSFPKWGGQQLGPDNKPTSVMNILNEQGDWDTWSRNLSRQVLSKQTPELAKSQLDVTYARRREELEKINALTNPLIKKRLLESFADETDSAAVHMKAVHMPNQATRVLLPVPSVKPTEIFAPTYPDGTKVALVRFPHAGTFEIPELVVNNKNPEARRLFSKPGEKGINAPDAVGIHPKVAERLSGADFDGDTVVVIPNNRGKITKRPPLEGLQDFDPHQYKVPLGPPTDKYPKGTPIITDAKKQIEMGKVTNLIADMTILGAKDDEIAAAVRHSMVVIDSEKHNLDYKASERDNGIPALKRNYQKGANKGASTLITRATSRKDVPKRKDAKAGPGRTRVSNATIDNETGKRLYELTGELDKRGKPRTFRSRKLAETEDARELLSDHGGTPIERIYADHSNRMKALANETRKSLVTTKPNKRDASAARVYRKEVESLESKIDEALRNAPLERRAQSLARSIIAQRRRANGEMDASEKKKIKGQALEEARLRTGANKTRIDITDDEWRAIQANALSISQMTHILNNTDIDKLRERATPRQNTVMTSVMTARAKAMLNSGATPAEVAAALGIPVSTLTSSMERG